MSTPEFITNLRAKIGNDPLWLTGITAYVEDAQGRILLMEKTSSGAWIAISVIGAVVVLCLIGRMIRRGKRRLPESENQMIPS